MSPLLIAKRFPASKLVHLPTLGDAIRTLMWGRATHLTHDGDGVILECADWTNVDLQAVQAAIDAAPEDTERQRAKWKLTHLETATTALIDVLRDLINQERARHGIAAVSKAALLQLVLDKVDTL